MNRFSNYLCALCTALFISASSFADDLANYQFPDWNDFEITFNDPDSLWEADNNSVYTRNEVGSNSTVSLSITVNVDTESTLCFASGSANPPYIEFSLTMYVDGVETNEYSTVDFYRFYYGSSGDSRFFEKLSSGTHTIELKFTNQSSRFLTTRFFEIGVIRSPQISVSLLEPGSLGQEVLHQVERLQDVRNLKISGRMNDDDWNTLAMMKDMLITLDLGDAQIENIPEGIFEYVSFLNKVVLPEGLLSIGQEAFANSTLSQINFPLSLKSIGYSAFSETPIKEVVLPDNCTELGGNIFSYCKSLRSLSLPANLKVIPGNLCYDCNNLQELVLHEGLTEVGYHSFQSCHYIHPDLPSTLVTLKEGAFNCTNCKGEIKTKLVIPESVTFIGNWVWSGTGYTEAVVPQNYNSLKYSDLHELESYDFLPSSIKKLRLNSPTVVKVNGLKIGSLDYANATLVVPDFLVTSYKLDNYWYQFGKIEGFSTEEVDDWQINADLILGSQDRLLGTPSIHVTEIGSLKINGTDGMSINNLVVNSDPDNKAYAKFLSNADGVTISGDLSISFRAGTRNRWYYLSLPYNVKVKDLEFLNNNPQRAIRYYDGANRAANGTGNNWKNYSDNDIIPAGTGFIFQVSQEGWWKFASQNDESKQNMTSNKMFVKALVENPSEVASNSGWNLVGNPYQAWYNIHKLNFTAPITVRNADYNNYEAYSIIDDDYALAPNQAFFVQCPTGTSEISFPLNGRQMTSEITSQNGAPAKNQQVDRVLVDLALNNGDVTDRTRVVLNHKASLDYETICDASKFLSESNVAQVYTLDSEGTMYAINERPVMDGEVSLGVIIPTDGTYSFSLLRNMADNVYVRDNATGETVEITNDAYEFNAEAGTYNQRFTLVLNSGAATGITTINSAADNTSIIYNVAGMKVNDGFKGIVIKNGKKMLVK